MILLEVLQAAVYLGLPVLILTWWVMHRLFDAGQLNRDDDIKTTNTNLKTVKKQWKKDSKDAGFIEKKWMKFGGGFYGLAALTTLIAIEISDAIGFVMNFPGFEALFANGIFSFIIGLIVNQFQNLLTAFIWFTYWPDDNQSIVIWFLVPYGTYLLGLKLAARDLEHWQSVALERLNKYR